MSSKQFVLIFQRFILKLKRLFQEVFDTVFKIKTYFSTGSWNNTFLCAEFRGLKDIFLRFLIFKKIEPTPLSQTPCGVIDTVEFYMTIFGHDL